jgi:nicotinate-nucleotide pyrophosphorylase (carboxylating)
MDTEASGNIDLENVVDYAETGVDYVSMGAITHSAAIVDLSLRAI